MFLFKQDIRNFFLLLLINFYENLSFHLLVVSSKIQGLKLQKLISFNILLFALHDSFEVFGEVQSRIFWGKITLTQLYIILELNEDLGTCSMQMRSLDISSDFILNATQEH